MVDETPKNERTPHCASADAIRIADRISHIIVESRPTILGLIISKRIKRETYQSIGDSLVASLEREGAATANVRKAVVARICQKVLSSDLARQIKHEIMSRRPSNLPHMKKKAAENS